MTMMMTSSFPDSFRGHDKLRLGESRRPGGPDHDVLVWLAIRSRVTGRGANSTYNPDRVGRGVLDGLPLV